MSTHKEGGTMKKFFGKKRTLALAVVAVLAVAGAAFAYFTANGSGSGSATVGSSTPVTLSGDAVGALYPGGADATATVSIHNGGSGTQHVGTISGAVADNGSCLGSWFVVDPIAYNADLAGGASDSATTHVRMTETGTNQDACQGKSMTINWSSN
jgi:hypothetical protein